MGQSGGDEQLIEDGSCIKLVVITIIRSPIKGVGAQGRGTSATKLIVLVDNGTTLIPCVPYCEGGEIERNRGRLGIVLFLLDSS